MSKYKGSTTLTKVKLKACLHSPTTKTIALQQDNGIQIRSLENTFLAVNTPIAKLWAKNNHKLTLAQQSNTQKILTKIYTFYIHELQQIRLPNWEKKNTYEPETIQSTILLQKYEIHYIPLPTNVMSPKIMQPTHAPITTT